LRFSLQAASSETFGYTLVFNFMVQVFLGKLIHNNWSRNSLILFNQKVHHHVQESPPLDSVFSQLNPVRTLICYFSRIHFIIIQIQCNQTLYFHFDILSALHFYPDWV